MKKTKRKSPSLTLEGTINHFGNQFEGLKHLETSNGNS